MDPKTQNEPKVEVISDGADPEIARGELVRFAPAAPVEIVQEEVARTDYLHALARLPEGRAILERFVEFQAFAWDAAVKRTRPTDWVLHKDRQGNTTATLTESGAKLVAPIFGVTMYNLHPTDDRGQFAPARQDYGDGVYGLRMTFDCAAANGMRFQQVSFERRNDEDFTGRRLDAKGKFSHERESLAYFADHLSSLQTGAFSKAVRMCAGMSHVPLDELQRCWHGTKKTVNDCRKGHGFGTATERTAQTVAETGAASAAADLWADLLRRTGGDTRWAASVLRECTADSAKGFKGFDSVERFTQDWQIKKCWDRLRKHSVVGDEALERAGGEREPGDDR